jgi:hypothetical protein
VRVHAPHFSLQEAACIGGIRILRMCAQNMFDLYLNPVVYYVWVVEEEKK